MEDVTHHPGSLIMMVGACQMLFGCFDFPITRSGNFFLPSKYMHTRMVMVYVLTFMPLQVAPLNVCFVGQHIVEQATFINMKDFHGIIHGCEIWKNCVC
jgi:hypothetical protein